MAELNGVVRMKSPETKWESVMQAEDSAERVEAGSKVSIPALALRVNEAALALGMSLDSFERHVEARVKILRLGRMKLVSVAELERFLAEEAVRIGGDW
jgi:hypothetical protein